MKKEKYYTFLIVLIFIVIFSNSVFGFFNLLNEITGFATSRGTNLSIALAGKGGPTIGNVSAIAAVNAVENSNKSVNFSFVASDPDGVANFNDSTALAIFNKTGEASRNATCTVGADINANSVNYTCSVNMWYFDGSGSWNVNVSVNDFNGLRGENSTTAGNMTGISFTLNALTAFIMNPTSLTWGTLNVVDTNQTSNNDPLGLNNTGNVDITNITVNATDLTGETDSAFRIYGENFTIANLTGGSPANECDFNTNATIPRRGQDTQINKTLMGRGNNSIATNSSREELFVCLTAMPANLTAQTYSTTQLGGWTVIIQ